MKYDRLGTTLSANHQISHDTCMPIHLILIVQEAEIFTDAGLALRILGKTRGALSRFYAYTTSRWMHTALLSSSTQMHIASLWMHTALLLL